MNFKLFQLHCIQAKAKDGNSRGSGGGIIPLVRYFTWCTFLTGGKRYLFTFVSLLKTLQARSRVEFGAGLVRLWSFKPNLNPEKYRNLSLTLKNIGNYKSYHRKLNISIIFGNRQVNNVVDTKCGKWLIIELSKAIIKDVLDIVGK